MSAIRTQIYLTSAQRERLDTIGRHQGKALAEMVREAVDDYLEHAGADPQEALDATFGALPELQVPSRDEWDRA